MKKLRKLPKKACLILTDNSEFQCDVYLYRLGNRFFEVWRYFYKPYEVYEFTPQEIVHNSRFPLIRVLL